MYLGCVSSLSSFRSSLDFLRFFKVAQKSGQSPCTIVQGFLSNFPKNDFEEVMLLRQTQYLVKKLSKMN